MSITKRIISSIISLTLVAVLVPMGNAQALTAEELRAQIEELRKQLAELQRQLGELGETTVPPVVSGCTVTSFDRNLKQGMQGEDVKCLQILLNSDEETQVATTGAGSPGNETTYFGSKTKAAVIKFQEKYAEEALTPLGLTTGTGFVGLATRAKLNTLLAVTPTVTPACTTDADCPTGKTCQNGVCVVPPVLPISAGLTVTLTKDTPVTGTIVAGQATADLARFSFMNGDSNPVKVTKVVLKRIGISGDDTLENVYLFEGNVRLTDAASVSQNTITFTNTAGLFTVPAKEKVDINVRADIKGGISGQTVGLQLTAATDITSDASAVTGVFPISANLMTIASAPLANADFTGTTLPGAGNIDPANDVMVWQRTLNVSNRDIYLNRIAFREIGSINYADLKNLRLYIDGVQVGPAVENLDSNGYVTFITSPYKLSTGTRVIKVIANVIGGSARTFSFSLRTIADIDLVDSNYNVNIRPTVGGGNTFTSITAGTQTVNSGNVTVQKATDSPSSNVIIDGSDIVLAKFTLTAYGEPVKIETLTAGFTRTTSGGNTAATLRNGRLIANGSQAGNTATLNPNGTSFTTNLTVTPGTPVTLEIRADIYDNDGTGQIANGDTIVARLIAGTNNAQGTNSLTIINVPPANRDGNTLTVASGAITLAKTSTYVNQNLVVPQTAFKIGSFILSGNPTEDVNINTIQVDFTGADAWTVTTLSDVYVKYGTYTTPIKPTVTASGNNWSVNYTLAKNAHLTVEVYANISADAYDGDATADAMTTSLLVTGLTAASGQTVYTNNNVPLTGQTMTATVGQITSAVDASTPVAKIVAGNTTQDVAAFKFTTVNDSYTLTQMVVSVGSSAVSAINNVILKDKTTVVGTAPIVGTTATFSGLSMAMPANTSKTLTVSLELGVIGSAGAPSGTDVKITLDSFKANNSQGVENTFANINQAANSVYVYKATPTISNVALPSTLLTTGTVTLAKFKIETPGTIGWKKVIFSITKTGGAADDPEITSASLYDADTNIAISGTVALTNVGTSSISGSVSFVATTEQEVSGTKTYILKATVAATALATGDNINTNIAQPSAYAAPNTYATVAGTTASFIWTDQSSTSHSETTTDWNNGYLVKNLPTDSQTLTK